MTIVAAAALAATIFSWWTASDFLPQAARDDLSVAQATSAANIVPTALPVENWEHRVGIVAGHRGYDSGAVCEDGSGLTEAEVNYRVAQLVVQQLRGMRYEVDLLDEFDDALNGYRASALVSIHADSCEYINDLATGYKVAGAASRMTVSPRDQHLVQCLTEHYGAVTGLPVHPSITDDMTRYHSFDEISPHTPAAIIEVGFLYLDRDLLTQRADVVAQGIIEGLLCYLETPVVTPTAPFIEPTPETPAAP
ncbi:MAG: N-acetylmuramoyl-L-alanine amidase [Anaerolineae bacterium]|nr:N-acetylmuramoyl-L-alanine amidase [Anaerolineae bacterium]